MSYPVGVTPNLNQYPISYQGVSTPVSPQMWAASPNFAGEDVYVPGQQQEEDDGLGVVGTAVAIGATAAGLFALAKKGKLGGAAEGWANKAWNTVKGGFDKMSSTVKGWFSKSGDDVAKVGGAIKATPMELYRAAQAGNEKAINILLQRTDKVSIGTLTRLAKEGGPAAEKALSRLEQLAKGSDDIAKLAKSKLDTLS